MCCPAAPDLTYIELIISAQSNWFVNGGEAENFESDNN